MKKNRNQFPFRRRIRKVTAHRQFKPLLLTVGASIFIGVTFGFIVLQMVNQEEEQDVENVQATALSVEETTENTIDLPAITVFVHQGGVITNVENAEQYSKELQQAKVPFIQRESDEQYFIWMNIANSEQEAKSLAEKWTSKGSICLLKSGKYLLQRLHLIKILVHGYVHFSTCMTHLWKQARSMRPLGKLY